MGNLIQGLHHVTALSGGAQTNLNFYAGVLGLRLVKKTINFDAPDVYHLYYGNETGDPGTIMTFFPFPGIAKGRIGSGQATRTLFSIPAASVGFWTGRLAAHGVAVEVQEHANSTHIEFNDPDEMPLALVANATDSRRGTTVGNIPAEHSIRGFYGVTLSVAQEAGTLDILTRSLEHEIIEESNGRFLLGTSNEPGALIEVLADPKLPRGLGGKGTVHHIAFATPTDDSQLKIQQVLENDGFYPTQVMDRQYFHSIYFREPGGVLFEVATVPPGFMYDEPIEALGTGLKLPPWVEPHRAEIERGLAPISLDEALAL